RLTLGLTRMSRPKAIATMPRIARPRGIAMVTWSTCELTDCMSFLPISATKADVVSEPHRPRWVRTRRRTHRTSWRSAGIAQRQEALAQLFGEQLGLFPCREVAASGRLVEVGEVRVHLLRPATRRLEELLREYREPGRNLDVGRLLARGQCGHDVLVVLP